MINELQAVMTTYGDLNVCMSRDSEGNGFYRLGGFWYSIGKFRDYDQFDQDDEFVEFGKSTDLCI